MLCEKLVMHNYITKQIPEFSGTRSLLLHPNQIDPTSSKWMHDLLKFRAETDGTSLVALRFKRAVCLWQAFHHNLNRVRSTLRISTTSYCDLHDNPIQTAA